MTNEKKSESELEKELLHKSDLVWDKIDEKEQNLVFSFADAYKSFIDRAKTERLAIKETVKLAEAQGFKDGTIIESVSPGDKLYFTNRKKNVILAIIGSEPVVSGTHIVASHVDAPRIDLKVNPVYEKENLALLRTHYYGGIKKYQWVNIPLALYGVVVKKDGSVVEVAIGEDETDPVFVISDLLPHLSRKTQGDRKTAEVIKGEELTPLAGAIPVKDEKVKKSKIKLHFLKLLNDKYDIKEKDFLSAELSLVPAMKSRYVGLDKGLLASYGHDDRICAYTSLKAIFDIEEPKYTSICYLMDKEEIGSDGNTGAQSMWLNHIIGELLEKTGEGSTNSNLFKALTMTKVLSSDVNAGLHPIFSSVQEKQNAAKIGNGVVVTKFTGSGGKYSTNDAHAEYLAYIRRIFDDANIIWQTGEMGKVDEGGGGTIAKFLARHNSDVVDIGPSLLGMHSPYELCHVGDLYMTYKAYIAFFNGN